MKTQQLTTELGKSYWNGDAAYSVELKRLQEELVPAMGEADTVNGELIRCISRLSYEYYNNGNINAQNVVSHNEEYYEGTDDDGEEIWAQEDYEEIDGVTPFFQGMLDFIKTTIGTEEVGKAVEKVERRITNAPRPRYKFTDEEERPYVHLCDLVMYYVLSTDNAARKIND